MLYPLTYVALENAKGLHDVKKVKEIINKGFPIRTTAEELRKLLNNISASDNTPVPNLQKKIKDAAGTTNFNNWWNAKVSINRQSAIKICMALQLSVQQAQNFMQSCWHDGFYVRDYKDLIYMFCLDKKLSYKEADEIIKKHKALDSQNPEAGMENNKDRQTYGCVTEALEREYDEKVSTVSGLEEFLESNGHLFGSFRRKAYEEFTRLYAVIKEYNDIDTPTDEEICQMILMNIPSLRALGNIANEILVKIAENTLPRSGLSEIINKTPDNKTKKIPQVHRKHLILLWLLIYGGRPELKTVEEAKTIFGDCLKTINMDILKPCGFPLLDSRNPFDWLIINALYYCHFAKGSDNADAVERVRLVTHALFEPVKKTTSDVFKRYEKALALLAQSPDDEYRALLYTNIGETCDSTGEHALALDYHQKALDLYKSLYGEEHPFTITALTNIACTRLYMKDFSQAKPLFTKAVKLHEKVNGKNHTATAKTYTHIATACLLQQNYEKALHWEQKALPIKEAALGENHPETAATYNNIAQAYAGLSDNKNAAAYYNKAYQAYKTILGNDHPDTADTYNNYKNASDNG